MATPWGKRPSGAASLGPIGVVLCASTVLTAAIAADDNLRFAYRNDELRVAMETAVALIALVVGVVAVTRFRKTRELSDALVAVAVLVIAYASLVYSALPMLFDDDGSDRFAVWAPLAARTLAAAVLAAAPWTPERLVPGRSAARWVVLTAGVVVGVGVVLALVPELPSGVSVWADIQDSARPQFSADIDVVVLQAVNMALFGICAVGSVRRRGERGDSYWLWIGVGAVLQAASRAHFALFPSLYSDWFYTGDVLRLGGYLAWFVAAGTEVRRLTHDRARLAVVDERRRMARELHDGLVQDLSFIHSQTAGGRVPTPEMMEHVATSANRALREARLAVAALSDTDEAPPEIALRAAAERIAGPAGVTVTCSFQPDAVVPTAIRHDLARIVQEAATNAVKHGRPSSIAVELDCPASGGLWLMVADDGEGFDPSSLTAGGYGFTSMRDRAERIGGRLTIDSVPGEGTVVEVSIDPEEGVVSARVFIVEDHDVLSHSLVVALAGVGMTAAVAERWSPVELLEDVRAFRPDVVLLDLHLGDEIVTLPLIPSIVEVGCSVVLLTASTERTQLAEAIQLGASAAMQKSEPFEQVVEAIRAAAEGRDAMSSRRRSELLDELRIAGREQRPLAQRLTGLTARERAVLDQLVAGSTPVQIAEAQFVAVSTVRSQLKSIYRKLGVNSQLAAVALARRAAERRSV